jgi:hypothetical protein
MISMYFMALLLFPWGPGMGPPSQVSRSRGQGFDIGRKVCSSPRRGHPRLRALDEAPRQGSEGAPDAWLELRPAFARGLSGVAAGDEVIVVTWLHRADREVLEVHPRNDPETPLTGVFATRSPDRPNPLGADG